MSAPVFSFGINQCTICDFAQKNHFIVMDGETMCKQCFLKNKITFRLPPKRPDVVDSEEGEPVKKVAKLEESSKEEEQVESDKCSNAKCENVLEKEKPMLHPVSQKLICEPCYRFHLAFQRDRAGDEVYLEEPSKPKPTVSKCTYCGYNLLNKRSYPGVDKLGRSCSRCYRGRKAARKMDNNSSESSSSRNSVDLTSAETGSDRESVIQFCTKHSEPSNLSGSEFLQAMVSLCEKRMMASDE